MAKIISSGYGLAAIFVRPRFSKNGNKYFSVKAKSFVRRYDKDQSLSDEKNIEKILTLFIEERGWDYPNGFWIEGKVKNDLVFTFLDVSMLEGR